MNELLAQALNPLIVVFVWSTMLGVGVTLTLRDLRQAVSDWPYLRRALLTCLLLAPALAWLLARFGGLDPALAAALFLLVTVPGAPGVIKFVSIARSDTTRAVSLVISLMFIAIAYQPLALPLLIEGVAVAPAGIARTLALSVLGPLLLGMLARARLHALAVRCGPALLRLSTFSGLLTLVMLPVVHWDELRTLLVPVDLALIMVFLLGTLGLGLGLGGPSPSGRHVLAFAAAQGNQAAAFLVAAQNFGDPQIFAGLIIVALMTAAIQLPLALRLSRAPAPTSRV